MKGEINYYLKKNFKLWAFVFYVLLCNSIHAEYSFTNFSTQQGLTHKAVFCLYEDSGGFIWIGTTNGLNRFDGYQFKRFFFDEEDSTSLCGNFITEIVEDNNHLMWIATASGYCYFDAISEKFHKIEFPNSSKPISPLRLCVSKNGTVWGINKGNVLSKMNVGNPQVGTCYSLDSIYPTSSEYQTWNIEYFNDSLWLCTSQGILKIDEQDLKGRMSRNDNYRFHALKEIRFNDNGELLFSGHNNDIIKYDANSREIHKISGANFSRKSPLFSYLTDAQYDLDGNVWASASSGLFKISQQGMVTSINSNVASNVDFENIRTNWIMRDKKGNMWIGTMDFGVFVLNNSNKQFSHINLSKENKSGTSITDFFRKNNDIYYSTLSGAYTIQGASQQPTVLSQTITKSIFDLSVNEVLLVGQNEISIYNTDRKANEVVATLDGYIHDSYLDSQGVLWVMMWGHGITGIDLHTLERFPIDVDTVDANNNIVFSMYEDTDSSLWLGMFGSGLMQVKNPKSKNPELINHTHSKMNPANGSSVILAIHGGADHNLWLGTNGGGLMKYDTKTQEFISYTTKQGLKNNVVESIISDQSGNIWFTTSIVSKYDIAKETFTHYDIANGINSKYFNSFTYADDSGALYFGDDSGLLTFAPAQITEKPAPKIPALTAFKIFGNSIEADIPFGDITPLKRSINYTETIELPHSYNSIEFTFASLQILENKSITYAFMLEGADKRLNYTNLNEYSASYSGLPPGKYTFKVKASNDRESWSGEKSVKLIISPPWWKTTTFIVTLSVLIAVFLYTVIMSRITRIQNEKIKLSQLVKERTEELEHSNTVLQSNSIKIHNQSVELHKQFENLKETKLVIEMKNDELTEALNLKDKLIGILSHDFKNPLNSLLGTFTVLTKQKDSIEKEQRDRLISNAGKTVQKIVAQMVTVLDWAQDQLHNIKVKPTDINLESILIDAIQLLHEPARQKKITIESQIECEHCAFADVRMVSTIFRNLLHNAIKFSHEGGNIIITINEDDRMHEISFIDTGVGIEEKRLKTLFHSYNPDNISYGTSAEKGTGLGLQVCKNFVDKNEGLIQVKSEIGKGTVFTVLLPKGETRITKLILPEKQDNYNLPVILDDENSEQITILLVDDNQELVTILKNIFPQNFKIIKAFDGKAGLYLTQNMLPNIIISDIHMPNMTGLELCKAVKDNNLTCHIPVILISAEKRENIARECFESGASDFLEKPFDTAVLSYKVKMIIDSLKSIDDDNQSHSTVTVELPESSEDVILNKIIELMIDNLENPEYDVNSIAETIGLNRTQLWRKTKNSLNKTPSELFKGIRMKKAHEMLISGKFRISEIAYSVGYNDPRVFQKSFSKLYGMPPSEYLKSHQK